MFHHLRFLSLFFVGILGLFILLFVFKIITPIAPILIFVLVLLLVILFLIIGNPYFGLYAMIFFLPFERIGSYDALGLTIRISQILFVFTLLGWFVQGIVHKRLLFQKNPLFFPLLLFLGFNTLSLLNAENIHRSFLVLIFTLFTISVSFLLPHMLTLPQHIVNITRVLFISTAVVSLFGFYQFIGDLLGLPAEITGLREHYTKSILGFPRVQSTALEPLYFAHFLLTPLSFAYALFLSKSSSFHWRWLLFILIIGSLNLILTVSRGGYIAFFVMIAGISLFSFRNLLNPKRVTAFTFVIVIVGLLTTRFLNIDNAWEKFVTHTQNIFSGASFEERIETFEQAKRAFVSHPWIGIGVGGFGPFMSSHPYAIPREGWKIVNNEFLELLAEVGVLGFSTFIVCVGILLIRSLKALHKKSDSFIHAMLVGGTWAFIATLVQYQTFSVLYIMQVWFLIGLLISIQNFVLQPVKVAS